MRQTHYVLVGACLVSLAIGYVAGGGRHSTPVKDGEKDKGRASSRTERTSGRDRGSRGEGTASEELLSTLLKGRNIQALSSSDLTDLVVDLSKYDSTLDPVTRARRNFQLQLLLSKLSPEQLEEAALVLAADPDYRRMGSLGSIIGAMTAKNPSQALAWAKEQKNSSMFVGQVIGAMAKDNPLEAADLYRSSLLDGSLSQNAYWEASFGLGGAVAKLGKNALLDFVDSLPRQQQSNVLSNSVRELPEGERLAMADEMYRRYKEGNVEEWSFKSTLSTLGSGDPAKLTEWMEKLPAGKDRAKILLGQATNISRMGESEAVNDWMRRAIAEMPGKEKELLQELRNSAYNNPADFATFAKLLPPSVEIKAADMKEYINNGYRGASSIVDMAGAVRDPEEKAVLVVDALNSIRTQIEERSDMPSMNATDYEILRNRLKTLNLTGDAAARVAEAFDAARDARPKPKE